MSRINTGLMNNSETNKNGTTNTHTHTTGTHCTPALTGQLRIKREASTHRLALSERAKLIGQMGVTKRTAVTAA